MEKNVLLVDDDLHFRDMIKTVLDGNGLAIYCAGDGVSALFLLESLEFNVIISDFQMPGICGPELIRIARNNYPDSLIIGISGDDVEKDFLNSGADVFLRKPFPPDALISLIAHNPYKV